jgi:hypothetical protein
MSREQKSDAKASGGVSIGQACFCVGFFFVSIILLNGSAMYRSATLLEYGSIRSFWMSVLQPVDCVSRLSGGNCLRTWAERGLGDHLNAETAQ